MKILEKPDIPQSTSRELFEMKQTNYESLDDVMTRVQFLGRKGVRKLSLLSREQIAVTAFWKGLVDHEA